MAHGKNDKRHTRGQWPARGPLDDFGFGSWHSGVTQFLRGDGSVQAVSWTTNTDVLRMYGHAQDGLTSCGDDD